MFGNTLARRAFFGAIWGKWRRVALRLSTCKFKGQRFIGILDDQNHLHFHSFEDVRKSYKLCTDHLSLAQIHGVTPRLVRKIMELAGIDYLRALFVRYEQGEQISDIARSIRMHPSNLSKQLREAGYKICRGKRRPTLTQIQISKAVLERKTINAVARKLQVHWETAKKALVENGFLMKPDAEQGAPYSITASPFDTS
ncbi:hypothetical protein L0664_17645 [Octadecabacter sp. G9-8]|uniref:Uncharacterized protein n=1 Tax=Octadecabacter dasysiphoniae TaxID=2909341 RepID=A0ABS9D2P3_9RHOB|nr:hypothetical protein [Octadecabacter dasysiphoniae]MCF2872894.1 hypothetical protein [Octadecabacter dasysiphoniae]